ncbi:MAG: SMI1/KNR4 family protein [Pseudomonas protegens]
MSDSIYTQLRNDYLKFYPEAPVPQKTIEAIEGLLFVSLPSDLKEISSFYSGGMLGGISHFEISETSQADNVTEKTLEWRTSINLPQDYIAIAEPPASLIVLDVKKNKVLWLSSTDAVRLNTGKEFLSDFDLFDSYESFFVYLLKLEAEEMEE